MASFSTISISLLKSTGTGTNSSTSNLYTLLSILLKLVGRFSNLSKSTLSILHYRLTKSNFLAKFDVSKPVSFFKSASLV